MNEVWLDIGDLLLVDFAAARDAVMDGLHVAAAHGQVQRAALGLVQVVDVRFLRVSQLLSCSSETVWVEKFEKGGLLHLCVHLFDFKPEVVVDKKTAVPSVQSRRNAAVLAQLHLQLLAFV